MDLVEEIFLATSSFPVQERFGLTSQLRCASVSIASNIGEGKRRRRPRAFLHHLDVALGSQGEVEVQIEIAHRIGFLRQNDYRSLLTRAEEIGKMLNGLIVSVEREVEEDS